MKHKAWCAEMACSCGADATIEKARERVIKAAKMWNADYRSIGCGLAQHQALNKAVDALNKLEG